MMPCSSSQRVPSLHRHALCTLVEAAPAFRLFVLITLLSSLLLVGACDDEKEIHSADYDQSCSTADDCLPVNEGTCDQCGMGCVLGAINKGEQEKYQTDYQGLSCKASNDVECSPCAHATKTGIVVLDGIVSLACEAGICVVKY